MQIFRGYKDVNQNFQDVVLTIGNFDGVHLAHKKIIEKVVARAKALGGTSIVYTFKPHPHRALSPGNQIQLINTYEEKLEFFSKLQVDIVIEEPFSREFSTISPEKFFREILVKHFSTKEVYVGYDFGFGKDRAGSLELLKKLCEDENVVCAVEQPLQIDNVICSSTKIRECIERGEIKMANKLLGREFFYSGLIVKGKGRGRTIGFPTANVHSESKLWVKEGVYATRAVHKGKIFKSVTNVGRQPTFNQDISLVPIVMETHIFDFDLDIYGETLEVRFVDRIRDEKKFASIDALVDQIKLDSLEAKKIIQSL